MGDVVFVDDGIQRAAALSEEPDRKVGTAAVVAAAAGWPLKGRRRRATRLVVLDVRGLCVTRSRSCRERWSINGAGRSQPVSATPR